MLYILYKKSRGQDIPLLMDLYTAVISFLHPSCSVCGAHSHAGNADAAKDHMLHTYDCSIFAKE